MKIYYPCPHSHTQRPHVYAQQNPSDAISCLFLHGQLGAFCIWDFARLLNCLMAPLVRFIAGISLFIGLINKALKFERKL
jgi:hypothetical protein